MGESCGLEEQKCGEGEQGRNCVARECSEIRGHWPHSNLDAKPFYVFPEFRGRDEYRRSFADMMSRRHRAYSTLRVTRTHTLIRARRSGL